MKLLSINISNYRSIEQIGFEFCPLKDKTQTFGLIGVNEAGKSSMLKALALKDGLVKLTAKDFRDKNKPIVITFNYELDQVDRDVLATELEGEIKEISGKAELDISARPKFESDISLCYQFTYDAPAKQSLALSSTTLSTYTFTANGIESIFRWLATTTHKTIFWTAEDNYLISKPINLATFASDPESISIPLKNCFSLADIDDIQQRIRLVGDESTEIEQLQTELGEKVTEHIKTVWPGHPIAISFIINNGLINFHVKDEGVVGRAKTADQRSDGFKQFVSFLLTISAQNRNEELSNSILLLDEPETHLHPQAQECLLEELIRLTNNGRNNAVIFATHSNYMIDKRDLSRNFRIEKLSDKTTKTALGVGVSSYASVTYEVFGISSTDYHNELFSKLHSKFQEEAPDEDKRATVKHFDNEFFHKIKKLPLNRPWKKANNQITLPTYIRNCIHHSDNGDTYTQEELKKSIEQLRSLF